jgi:hypothetical protein
VCRVCDLSCVSVLSGLQRSYWVRGVRRDGSDRYLLVTVEFHVKHNLLLPFAPVYNTVFLGRETKRPMQSPSQ